ncbi:MAG TPA: site-specific integrase, partial [Candidatus Krumholzibacteria bacterium]|nr:site-specific integrase [Candidatus Krumholzibacteria bacterium]
QPKRADRAVPCAYTIVATVLLTGMRPREALGLRIEDIDWERGVIRVRRNSGRRLKNRGSKRFVPLWPQLERILRAYLEERGGPTEGFLFPSPTRDGKPVRTIKRLVTELGLRVDLEVNVTPKVLRHTYCAARLQTTDGDKPVAALTVARELGHRDTAMVERVYGHADTKQSSFPRREFVAYELSDYQGDEFASRLAALEERSCERNRPAPVLLRRVAPETELAILRNAAAAPHLGPRKAAEVLRQEGHEISASGVRWILLRYDLHREDLRREGRCCMALN